MPSRTARIGIVIVMACIDVRCFGMGEATPTSDPLAWFLAGLSASAALTVIGATLIPRTRPWGDAARFALLVAVVVGGSLYTVASVSSSRDCANQGQLLSAGTYDCDTSDALGAAFLIAGFFIPAMALVAAGRAARLLMHEAVAPDACLRKAAPSAQVAGPGPVATGSSCCAAHSIHDPSYRAPASWPMRCRAKRSKAP